MFLFELDRTPKLIATFDQFKTDLENGELDPYWTVSKVLKYFQDYDIILNKQDLRKPPFNTIISDIGPGNKIIFKEPETAEAPPEMAPPPEMPPAMPPPEMAPPPEMMPPPAMPPEMAPPPVAGTPTTPPEDIVAQMARNAANLPK